MDRLSAKNYVRRVEAGAMDERLNVGQNSEEINNRSPLSLGPVESLSAPWAKQINMIFKTSFHKLIGLLL